VATFVKDYIFVCAQTQSLTLLTQANLKPNLVCMHVHTHTHYKIFGMIYTQNQSPKA